MNKKRYKKEDLLRGKTKKFTTTFNPVLWELFVQEVEKEGKKPTHKLENFILEYLEEKGLVE